MIRSLDQDVRSLLRSGIAVSSLTQCLDELVVNSLDAGATCVSVRVDIPSFRLQVIDNGCGISKDDLELLGERYATSKCHSLEDLNELKFYGFRGEALASIRDIAGILEVVTRHRSSYKTHCKFFRNGKPQKVAESCLPRSNVGTTVTAYDVFSSLPVRQKLVSEVFDFERIRQSLASIALINPNVSFTLYNEASGQKCLQTHKSHSVVSTFSQLFGNLKAKSLREIVFDSDSFKISGYVGLETHHNKNLQFLYVNGRLLLKTKIHKLVNRILSRSLLLKRTLAFGDVQGDTKQRSPPKQGSEKYPMFILNICCSLMDYDITLEPAKTLVEFEDWDGVLSCVQASVESFLVKENLMAPAQQTEDMTDNNDCSQAEDSSDSQVDLSVFEYQTTATDNNRYTKCISPSNIRKSLQSSVVHRKSRQFSSVGERSSIISSQSAGHKNELTNNTEKSTNILNDSLIHSELFRDVTKDCQKTDEKAKECSLQSGIEKPLNSTTNEGDLLCSRVHISSQQPNTTFTRTFPKSCFTSPNPITLQSRRTRKRLLNDADTKVMDNDNSSLTGFILDRYIRPTGIDDTSNDGNFGNQTSSTNKRSSRIPISRDILAIHGPSALRDGLNANSVIGRGNQLVVMDSPGGNREHKILGERSLDGVPRLDVNCTVESSDANKTDVTETKQSSLFNQGMVAQEHDIKEDSGPGTNNSVCQFVEGKLSSRAIDILESGDVVEDKLQDKILDEKGSSRELRAASQNLGYETGDDSEAPTATDGLEDVTRKEHVDDHCDQNKVSCGLGHDDKDGPLNNWQCTYDTHQQRKLYINLRTGNTCYECPEGFTRDVHDKPEDDQNNEKETRVRCPLACAPHVSFDCTPWLPRRNRENRARVTRTTRPGCETRDSVTSSSQSIVDEKAMTEKPLGGSEGVVSLMFDEWDNPVFDSLPGMDITSLSKPAKGAGNEVRTHTSMHPYRFTKDMVKNLRVIRQVDDKFIVCRARRPHGNESDDHVDTENEEEDCLIVLLDQHAVHERIRLEKLISDLYVSETSHTNQPCLKSSTVSPPIQLEFTSHELLLLKRFRSELRRVGVRFVIGSDFKSSESYVIVHELPSPFVDREVSETRRRRPSVAVSIVKELVQNHVEHMRQTNGVAPTIPKTILRVLSSQACHGAVRFGESLSVEECQQLIQDLSKCDLPFQCAHGRPSIVPLVDLQLLTRKGLQRETRRPKLRKLTNAIYD